MHSIQHISGFRPGEYVEGPDWIKLNTNENPFAPSPRVLDALRDFIGSQGDSLRRYPQPWSPKLTHALAGLQGLKPEQVVVSNGTQELLEAVFRVVVPPGAGVAFHEPGYGLYQALTLLHGAVPKPVLLSSDQPQLDVDAWVKTGAHVCVLSCPHSPTGVRFELEAIRSLLEHFTGYVVVDEAYVLFGKTTALSLLAEYPRLIITRTFSKSHQMAGIRVAYALANAELIEQMRKCVDPYAVDRLAEVTALAALDDAGYIDAKIAEIVELRDRVYKQLLALGWKTFRSEGNFLFTQPRKVSGTVGREAAYSLYEFLMSKQILVRHLDDAWACSYIRFGIGCEQTMDKVFDAIKLWATLAQP
ncbi:MAG TPA: histidinol-phosphate transaminase [Opitutales bacterium]|nr:histidinol-phosphate transaminase [Opitutales bacterium]